jgi:hypothetical protein
VRKLDESVVLSEAVFPSLVAYVGEVIRLAIGGTWELHAQKDGTWEPEVADQHREPCGLLGIYKELLEHKENASLAAFAQVKILNHRAQQ